MTTKDVFPKGAVLSMASLVDYANGGVVSKQVLKNDVGNITLFSFDKGQGLSEHAAPFDAFVQVLEGVAEIKIGGQPFVVKANESIIMPASITHALQAVEKFKMLLTMIKG
jgi:quercetin dioxygenase-like cupin family protein